MGMNTQRGLSGTLATTYLIAAVKFAQLPLDRFDDAAVAAAERVVQRILYRNEPQTRIVPGELDRRVLKELQRQSLALLRDLAEPSRARFAIAGDLVLSFWAVGGKNEPVRIMVMGSQPARYLYKLIRLIEEVGVDKLRACPAHAPRPATGVCGQLFVKVTKKEFCSTRCQSRTYMRHDRDPEPTDRDAVTKGNKRGKAARKK